MLYDAFKPMLISPCFHYLITHCNEAPVLDKPTRNSLLSYDEVRTLMYIMFMSRKEGISIEQLKQLYIMIDIQYHSYSWVSKGSTSYFDKDISNNACFDADKLVVEIENRLATTLSEYTKFKCSDFYAKIRKDRELCKCCPFYRSKKSNYALEEKFHLICYMMRSHENFNNIVNTAAKFNINMRELLYYNYDIRVCGALPIDIKEPLLIPFFQVLYDVCSVSSPNDTNAFIDSSIELNPDIVLKNDTLFIKLLEYLVSENFIYHKDWRNEFEEIFHIKTGVYNFDELLADDMMYKTNPTIKWLESMYKEIFTGARYEENFSFLDTIETIALNSRGSIFLSKEDFQNWKKTYKTSDVVPADYFTQNIFATDKASIISGNVITSIPETSKEKETNEINADTTSNLTDTTIKNIADTPSMPLEESKAAPSQLLPGVHITVDDFLNGITTVEQANELYADKLKQQMNFSTNIEHEEKVSNSKANSVSSEKIDINFDVNSDVNSDVNVDVNSDVNVDVNVDSKKPLNTRKIDVNGIDFYTEINTDINIDINTDINTDINIDINTDDEMEYTLLDPRDPNFVAEASREQEDINLVEETIIQYSKVLFDNYIEYRRTTSSIPSSRTIYYSPAELLTNYPLDITMAGDFGKKLQKNRSELPLLPAPQQEQKLIGDNVSQLSRIRKIVGTIIPNHTDTTPKSFPNYPPLSQRENKLLNILFSQSTTNVPRKSYISFSDTFFANYDFSKLVSMLPDNIVSSTVLRKYATNLSFEHGLRDFETALIKDHCLCVEAVCDRNNNDYLLFFLNSMSITGSHKTQNKWYYIKLNNSDVIDVIGAYISRKSYVKICYSSHQLYATFKKYNIPFRNIFSISSALGIIANKYNAVPYQRLYKNMFNHHIFDNKRLPDIMNLMRKNVTMYRCLESLLNHLDYTETWEYQKYFDMVLGCSYLPYNVFPVSKCSFYRVIDYNTYYMNSYTGRNTLMNGSFIRFSVRKKFLNSLEDYALVPAVLVALAYKGFFRKYHIYLTEYSSYSCNLFVEEKAVSTTLSIIISEATNRIKLMYPERIKNVSLLDIDCSTAHCTQKDNS